MFCKPAIIKKTIGKCKITSVNKTRGRGECPPFTGPDYDVAPNLCFRKTGKYAFKTKLIFTEAIIEPIIW